MAGTMPSVTACRARSSLVQWVMCNPSAIGSRQASWTICARWRGGNHGRSTRPLGGSQEARHPQAFVAVAGAPDGRLVTPGFDRHGSGPTPVGHFQDDSSPLNLKEGQGLAPGDLLQGRDIGRSDREGVRLTATHGANSVLESVSASSIVVAPNSGHYFVPGTLAPKQA
jgi:hypothetical protein